jgi:hypothetical protein
MGVSANASTRPYADTITKQAQEWQLTQPEPGVLQWRTPAGRIFTTTPTEYPQ